MRKIKIKMMIKKNAWPFPILNPNPNLFLNLNGHCGAGQPACDNDYGLTI